jgi:murein DD-endopeptidase MepM/ murein hydrolase activator NlpD
MLDFLKDKKKTTSRASLTNKTVILLSESRIYSLRVNPFFQLFSIILVIIISSFITYHVTVYLKSQSSLQEKDHKIFLGETINKNLSSHLKFVIEEINKISGTLSEGSSSPSQSITTKKSSSVSINASSSDKILTELDFQSAKTNLKRTIIRLDKTIDAKISNYGNLLSKIGLSDLAKSKNILSYKTYKSFNFKVQNINYTSPDIASEILSEIKYKAEYLKILQDLLSTLPTATPIKAGRISSGYGIRIHPILKARYAHHGLDLVGSKNATVHAAGEGIVKFAGWSNSFGNVVMINHGNDVMTIYAHMSSIKVKKDQPIKRNDIVGNQGSTGRSNAEHLHYEVRYKGKSLNPINFIKLNETINRKHV